MLAGLGMLGPAPEDALPERIGGFRVVGALGRGGMGVVYEAEQESPRRRVALKVLRPGAGSTARFRFEAELLARLQHPGIAQVHEVGDATVGGVRVPYFAMELVRGRPLDRYAAEEGLDPRARLELLAEVCAAVHHAHQQGVIHRDLKPANVLVDEAGRTRVLDFGLARAVDPDLELVTRHTLSGQLLGTLAYMSPEQAAGEPDAVDIRTDVYALGVIAYELLSGRRPHDTASSTMLEALRALRDDVPPRLGELDPRLRGDVETIVSKALEKDRERRYASVNELRADVLRHLADEPIAARPPSAAYQLSRFAKRNKVLVAGAAAVLAALALGLAGTAYGLWKAEERRLDAEGRLRQAEAVLEFQQRMLSSADPEAHGREARVIDVLASAALELEGAFDGQPEVEAAVRRAVGATYASLGLWPEAERHLARAVLLYERALGPDDPQTLGAKVALGGLYGGAMGRFDEGERLLLEVRDVGTRALGASHGVVLEAELDRVTLLNERARFAEAAALAAGVVRAADEAGHAELALGAWRALAWSLERTGDFERAVEAARESLAEHVARYGDEHPRTLRARSTLGVVLQNAGLFREGGELVASVLAARRRLLGDEHPETLRSMANLVPYHIHEERWDEGEQLARDAVRVCTDRFGRAHAQTVLAMNNLGTVLTMRGEHEAAARVFEDALEVMVDFKGPEHMDTVQVMRNLAKSLQHTPRHAEAEPLLVEALAIGRRTRGDRDPDTLVGMAQLGSLYSAQGRHDEAELLLGEAVEVGREVLDDRDPKLATYVYFAGSSFRRAGHLERAEPLLLEAFERFERLHGPDHRHTRHALTSLEGLYRAWGRPEEAERYAALRARE